MEVSGRPSPRRECNDESARVRLMSSKKKATERKKQKRLEKQRSYDKKWRAKKKRKTKENRTHRSRMKMHSTVCQRLLLAAMKCHSQSAIF